MSLLVAIAVVSICYILLPQTKAEPFSLVYDYQSEERPSEASLLEVRSLKDCVIICNDFNTNNKESFCRGFWLDGHECYLNRNISFFPKKRNGGPRYYEHDDRYLNSCNSGRRSRNISFDNTTGLVRYYDGSIFFFKIHIGATRAYCEKECAFDDSDLATIYNEDENNLIYEHLTKRLAPGKKQTGFYIGMKTERIAKKSPCTGSWDDHSPVNFSTFAEGEPNCLEKKGYETENAVVFMVNPNGAKEWKDIRSTSAMDGCICRRKIFKNDPRYHGAP